MSTRKLRLVGCVLASLALSTHARAVEGDTRPEIPWRDTPDLEVENLGRPAGAAVFAELPLMPVEMDGGHVQAFWYRGAGRKLHFVTLNVQTGQVTTHAPVAGHEVWRTLLHGGKLYLGLNLPASLIEYDPTADAFKECGTFSEGTIMGLVPTPDGKVAVGLSNGPVKVLLFDPATGQAKDYGVLSEQHGYVYELAADRQYLYAALRGAVPWQLLAVHRNSEAKTVVLTAPVKGYINVGADATGPVARVVQDAHNPSAGSTDYRLQGEQAVPLKSEPAPAPLAVTPEPRPEVLFDDSTASDSGKVRIYYRLPQDRPTVETPDTPPEQAGWKVRDVEVTLEPKEVTRILLWDERTIHGSTGPYGPLFFHDIASGTSRYLALGPLNVYSMAKAGDRLAVCGYPTSTFAMADLSRPFTNPRSYPGRPGVEWHDSQANPRILSHLAQVEGLNAHTGVAIFRGADGRLYILAMRHRYARGSDLAWYDPVSGEFSVVDDGGRLVHQQASWIAPIDEGKKLIISTRLNPDPETPDSVPKAGKLLIFDTATGQYEREYIPFPDEPALGAVTEVRPGLLLGLITEPAWEGGRQVRPSDRMIIYLFDLREGKVLKERSYGDILVGVPGLHGTPWRGHGFEKGPDGFIWTLDDLPWADSPEQFVRIHPDDLTIHPVGRIPPSGWVRFLFVGDDIYFTGAPQLRRIRAIVPR